MCFRMVLQEMRLEQSVTLLLKLKAEKIGGFMQLR